MIQKNYIYQLVHNNGQGLQAIFGHYKDKHINQLCEQLCNHKVDQLSNMKIQIDRITSIIRR